MKVECCICFEDFNETSGQKISTPKCGHLFHEECINKWLTRETFCPQCRLTVNINDLHYVYLSATSNRRSSIFNSTICQNYREVQEELVMQQESNKKAIADLKIEVSALKEEKDKSKAELTKLKMENDHLKAELKQLRQRPPLHRQPNNNHPVERPLLQRQKSNNVESIVAKAWKK